MTCRVFSSSPVKPAGRGQFLKRLVVLVGLVLPAPTHADGVPEVRAVTATPGRVELRLSAPTGFLRTALRGNPGQGQPERCYVDLSPASLHRQVHPVFDVNTGPVRRVRVSQFSEGTVRVVLDLRSVRECRVSTLTAPDRLVISAGAVPTAVFSRLKPAALCRGESCIRPAVRYRTITRNVPTKGGHTVENRSRVFVPSSLTGEGERVPILVGRVTHFRPATTTVLTRRLLQTWETLSLAFRPFSPLPFLPAWSLEQACKSVGCGVSAGGFMRNGGVHKLDWQEFEGNPERALWRATHGLGKILTGGAAMHDAWMVVMTVGLLLSFLGGVGLALLLSGRRGQTPEKKPGEWEARMASLEETVKRAGILNSKFFHSLEVTQKRLESLLAQADWAEQSLRRLLTQAAASGERIGGRTDSYTTAALLLAEGEGVRQVARVLKLPLAQVRLLQELQQHAQKEEPAGSQEKVASVESSGLAVPLLNGLVRPLNGVGRNGMHLAANRREL